MNKETQSVGPDKTPVLCHVLLLFSGISRVSEETGLKQTILKVLYPAHAELLVAKVASRKVSGDRGVLLVRHHPSISQEGKPGEANCGEQRTEAHCEEPEFREACNRGSGSSSSKLVA